MTSVQENISLKPYNTFGFNVNAKYFTRVNTAAELLEVLKKQANNNVFILGGGSNVLLTKPIEQLVIQVNIKGIQVYPESDNSVLVTVNAGENWHDFVCWTINKGYGGLENLSLIPGNVGAAPIQNIGAYGVELKDVFVSCNTIKISDQSLHTYTKADCNFGYRNSIFKTTEKGKHVITSVTFRLTIKNHSLNYGYGAIHKELEKLKKTPSIASISEAVIRIRQAKLPDPKEIGNSGSFFKNPIISLKQYQLLQEQFPDMPHYPVSETEVKIPAGWLIEQVGFKGKTFENYGVYKNQALILVNYGEASGKDILELAELIQHTIKRIYNITLAMEVNII